MIDGEYIEMGGFLVKIFNDRWGFIIDILKGCI